MIQANEFRLGNWVMVPGADVYCKISAIFKTHFRATCEAGIDRGPSLQTNYNPIPLTPEVFKSCAFIRVAPLGYYLPIRNGKAQIEVAHNNDTSENQYYCYIRELLPDNDLALLRKDLKFLHELQNLYHALTGQELEIRFPALSSLNDL